MEFSRVNMGSYRSGNETRSLDEKYTMIKRETPLKEYREKYCGKEVNHDQDGNPIIVDFSMYNSLNLLKSGKPTLLIGFDSEWCGSPREILTWQFALINKGIVHEYIIKTHKDRIHVDTAIGVILDDLGYNSIDNRSDKKDDKAIDVTLAAHAGLGDISGLNDKDRRLLFKCSEIQGGMVTLMPVTIYPKSYKTVNNPRHYKVTLHIADSMAHTVNEKSLADLGKIIGIKKIELPEGTKEDMKTFLKEHPSEYIEYSIRDSIITLFYLSALYGYNRQIPTTLNSAGARIVEGIMMGTLKCTKPEEFLRAYKGLKKLRTTEFKNNKAHIRENQDYISDKAKLVDQIAADSYHGGYNSCPVPGYYDHMTYDFDIQNAYPTAMCLIPAVDWTNPIEKNIVDRYITLDDFITPDGILNPLRMIFIYGTFEFPAKVKYPTLPMVNDKVPFYPRTSNGRDGVYLCGPEVYLALKLGAKVYCERGMIVGTREERVLAEAVKLLVEDRSKAPKDSFVEAILKTLVNSIYGKVAQDVDPKNKWCAKTDSMENIGPSAITNPVLASMITSIIRAVLLAAQNEITEKDYQTYSVTTDGFITDYKDVENLDLYGFAEVLHEAREFLTGDKTIWKIKHHQDDLLNITTRGNVSLSPGGVCAHNGYKTGKIKDSYEDRLALIIDTLSRTGNLHYNHTEWISLKEMLNKNKDFETREVVKSANMDYDMKRKPVKESFNTVTRTIEGKVYEVLNFDTKPFEDEAEFVRYRTKKKHSKCLKTEEQMTSFLIKAENPGTSTKIRNLEFSRLMSAVMAHRSGLVTIPTLASDISVKEKLDFINRFNDSGMVFKETAWKDAAKPKRQKAMLPLSEIQDLIDEMINSKA